MATHAPKLDHGLHIPEIHQVGIGRPLQWLKDGWQDFLDHPGPSLTYGIIVTLLGWLVLTLAAPRPYLFTAAISGFLLIAPLIAAGIYELTRQREQGSPHPTFLDSLRGLRKDAGSIADFSIVLVLAAILWERVAAILFALFYGGEMSSVDGFIREVFLSGNYPGVVLAWFVGGGLLASLVFSITVIGMPMVVDRNADIVTAMATSVKAVIANSTAMALWAAIIVGLVALGMLTFMLGFLIIMPWLGHATWCAYKDLIKD